MTHPIVPHCPTSIPLDAALYAEEYDKKKLAEKWSQSRSQMLRRSRARLAAFHVEMYGGAI